MSALFKSEKKRFLGFDGESGKGARRVKLFFTVFVLAVVVSGLAVVFVPKVRSVLHSSAESRAGQMVESLDLLALFKDVAPDSDFASEIAFLKKKALAKGFDDGTYKPLDSVKREEFIKLTVAARRADPHPLMNSYCFKDVGNEWFARYVCHAKNRGLVQGYEDGRFGVGSNITVREAMSIIDKSFGADLKEGAVVPETFLPGVLPEGELTRAQAAGLVVRALNAANAAR